MQENWRPVVGFDGYYEVSDQGRVRSIAQRVPGRWPGQLRRVGGRVLKPYLGDRYPKVCLKVSSKQFTRYIHCLVAEAFIGQRPEGMYVCHWDGDPFNNHIENLRYDTPAENNRDKARHGRGNAGKTHCKWGHPFDDENTAIRYGGRGRTCRKCRNIAVAKATRKKREREAA